MQTTPMTFDVHAANPWKDAHLCPNGTFFDDIDEQAASLNGWNQQYLQLSSGRFQGAVHHLALDGIGLFIEDLHQAVHQTGCVRPDVIAFGVPVLFDGEARFCGQTGTGAELHFFSGSQGFEFRSPRRHIMLGIEVQRSLFESHFPEELGPSLLSDGCQSHLRHADPEALQQLRTFALQMFYTSTTRQAPAGPQPCEAPARDGLLDRLFAVLESPAEKASASHSGVHALEQRARALMLERMDTPPSVAELCQLLGVSRRTLQNCFQATWGMGPLACMNTLRLNAARRRLKTATSVTEAATEFGFWHFGHFSQDYQTLFGILPSRTLCKQPSPAM
jgi:AraC family ethanolamine operon transcriptional activator